ncbi:MULTISPECIES: VanW family protein [unclassified Bacillus (in: firmicutes)]|uniref:VanW family protein n=1 Tax=unclassified Bacillus (in: firmicutes) TaxID=185979 RepID=UPI0008F2B4D9|nr:MULTISPECIES: VanW family protein [unclassified Bacillus (in: firmicutes)]SFI38349.1 Vancomycin resistance protein YoaR, contains peptidoglycan-binding and VanW domains [Bacillus sp. 71mf]SFT11205.1 Vancomycin resistance protein YoaR, contains peptidoglycan-binding and VanW domains [Bacillus sp. 103mf]
MLRKFQSLVLGTLCLSVVSGCSGKVSEVALVSGAGDHAVEAKAEVNKSISLVDGRTGKEVKNIDLASLGYFEDEKTFKKEVAKVVSEIAKSVDTKMVPSRMKSDGTWVEGKPSYELMEKELIDKLMNAGMWDSSYQLPIVEKKPVATAEAGRGNGTVIGRFETNLGGSTGGRIENIRLSSNTVNGVVLGKGDRFSFNSLVGDTTPDKGYQLGKEIVDGKLVDGYGGGVCQTSSTLFNAADQAGLKMVERSTHSKEVGYVPKGRDATIAYPYLDLVFENASDNPVKLVMFIDGQKLIAEVHAV